MKRNLKLTIVSFLVALVAFTAAYTTRQQNTIPDELGRYAQKIEKAFRQFGQDFDAMVNNTPQLNSLAANGFQSPYVDQVVQEDFVVLIYSDRKALYWSDNHIRPQPYVANALREGSSFFELQNGYYRVLKETVTIEGEEYTVLGMLPVKRQYAINNNYLVNRFNPLFGLPDFLQLTTDDEGGAYPVMNEQQKPVFYLTVNPMLYQDTGGELLFLILFALGAIALGVALHYGAVELGVATNHWLAFSLLAITVIGLRYIMLVYFYPHELMGFKLFDAQMYASSTLNRSLGDLLVNILLGLWLARYFYGHIELKILRGSRRILGYLIAVVVYFLILLGAFEIGGVFRSLIIDSTIPFDFSDLLNLTVYSFIGLLCFAVLLMAYLLISFRLLHMVTFFGISREHKLSLLLTTLSVFLVVLLVNEHSLSTVLSVAWAALFVVFLHRLIRMRREMLTLTNFISVLILFSLLSSIHLNQFNNVKELERKKAYARKLATERDDIGEYLFLDIQQQITEDRFVSNYFLRPFITTQEIVERIKTKYFTGYFNKYNVNVFTLTREGKLIETRDEEFFNWLNDELLTNAEPTQSDNLFYISRPSGNYAYIGQLPILRNNKHVGTIILEMTPKIYKEANLYPELLLEEKVKPPEEFSRYDFGVYSGDLLVNKGGDYPYDYRFGFTTDTTGEYTIIQHDNLEHLIYATGNKTVVVSSPLGSIIEPVSLFSYLFCIYLVFGFVVIVVVLIVRSIQGRIFLRERFSLSFRDKIQLSMISMIVFSFFVIGLVTVLHFTNEYDDYHIEQLVRKEKAVRSTIEYIINDNPDFIKEQDYRDVRLKREEQLIDITSLSDIHAMDINLYDLEGKLINSSQPDIFEKGLIAPVMDPLAYWNLSYFNKSRFIQTETIGNLQYLSIYVPVIDESGQVAVYMNLPYFANQKELNQEISSFLVALINVYVFLLVLGGFLAYVLSDSITRSLSAISEKIKHIELGKKNEPIEWKSNDEIGVLVQEYNKMLKELEHSANLLARSERESAWREMAKQVAHEIKNPLTPMKLHIQLLQRAMNDDRPDAKERANKVANTLIEQIDNLSHIATEFSSFAKMPRVQFAEVNLNEVIHSVVNLFGDNKEEVEVTFNSSVEQAMVYADKNQLIRVFNNLTKNAKQAIPDDRKGDITIRLLAVDNNYRVEVEDNGSGIPEERRDKVFEPSFTTKSSGMGLGLAMTRQIIENSGGEIWFESEEEAGTTFFVELPKYENQG